MTPPQPKIPITQLIYDGTLDFAVDGIETPSGTIIAAWEHSDVSEGDPSALIRASKSNDGGITWSPIYILQDTPNKRDTEPEFIVIGNKVFFFWTVDETACSIYYKTSSDNGQTWTNPIIIDSSSRVLFTSSHPIQLFSGRIILPIYYDTGIGYRIYGSSIYYSDDNGVSWIRGGNIQLSPKCLCEPTVVQLSDGTLYMLMRENNFGLHQWSATSSDEGITWSTPIETSIPSPEAQSHLIKLANGHVILLWNDVSVSAYMPRDPLTVALSTDNCDTWANKINIRQGSAAPYWGFSNMGILLKRNGDIIALYADESVADIYACIFNESSFQIS